MVASVVLGDSVLIGAKGLMLRLDDLPRYVRGIYNGASAVRIEGQPGMVSQYGLTSFSADGRPLAAWVSAFGVHQTDGFAAQLLTADLDWSRFTQTSLSSAAIHWWKEEQILVLSVPADNEYWYLHMRPEHRKGGLPKLSGPHSGAFSQVASGVLADGSPYIWAAHNSDGTVRTAHESSRGDGFTVQFGREYADRRDWAAVRGSLRHTDFGLAEKATLTWDVGEDDVSDTATQSKTTMVSLSGQRGHSFFLGLAGEWHEPSLAYAGSGLGALQDIRIQVRGQARSGAV